jgi:glycine C-acetyltransferase
MDDLESKLKETADCGTVLIITDGVFSMEGYIAPLPEIIALAKKYGALVMVDDSHATGVIGKTGRGTAEYWGITEGVDIISGTLGKALGGAGGGFIAAKHDVCQMLIQKSRPHLFSNSLPPVLCAVGNAAINYLREHPDIVGSLRKKTAYMREKIKAAGLNPLEGDSAIIPIILGDTAKAIRAADLMMEKGLYTIGFGFPVVPEGLARVRLQISDALDYSDLEHAAGIIAEAVAEVVAEV